MLIIKCLMLKVKNLSLLSQRNEKKGIWTRLQEKIELCLIFIAT